MSRPYRVWTTGEVRTVVQLLRDGHTVAAIAERIGRTYLSTKNYITTHALRKVPRG